MKLTKAIFHNYRGWKHQEFNFVDGLNTIVGKSDAGKSAILKGIDFVVNNNQSGNIFSNWILDEKGKIVKGESCWVELHTDTGHIIRRERGRNSSDNIYQIDDNDPIRNFNQGVPEDVQEILNLSDVNLQTQFETHYMLNDKPSEVAKTLNKMVDLEIIDSTIANINKITRKISKDKDASDANLKTYEEDLSKFGFIEAMEEEIDILTSLESSLAESLEVQDTLGEVFSNIHTLKDELDNVNEMVKHSSIVEDVLNLFELVRIEESSGLLLHEILCNIHEAKDTLSKLGDTSEYSELANTLIELFNAKASDTKEYNKILDCIEEIESLEDSLKSFTDIDKHQGLVAEIENGYIELEKLEDDKEKVELILLNIETYEDNLIRVKKDIKKDFNSIKGEACPMCGQAIKTLEGVC